MMVPSLFACDGSELRVKGLGFCSWGVGRGRVGFGDVGWRHTVGISKSSGFGLRFL